MFWNASERAYPARGARSVPVKDIGVRFASARINEIGKQRENASFSGAGRFDWPREETRWRRTACVRDGESVG